MVGQYTKHKNDNCSIIQGDQLKEHSSMFKQLLFLKDDKKKRRGRPYGKTHFPNTLTYKDMAWKKYI